MQCLRQVKHFLIKYQLVAAPGPMVNWTPTGIAVSMFESKGPIMSIYQQVMATPYPKLSVHIAPEADPIN
jgi:hypothetical protein